MSTVDSNSFTIQVLVSQLQQTIAGLSAGQSSTAALGTDTGFLPDRFGDQEMNWIQTFYYDEVRRIAWGMCQRHQGTGTYAPYHFQYTESTNTWVCEEATDLEDTAAHTFSCPSYDYATGDRYHLIEGGRTNVTHRWANGSGLGTWAVTGNNMDADIPAMMNTTARLVSGAGAMAFHPNLFGTGNEGLVLIAQEGLVQLNLSTGAYSTLIPDNGSITDGGIEPGLIYIRGLDSVLVCSNNSAANRNTWLIGASGTVTQIDDTPIDVGPDVDGGTRACPVDDPQAGSTCYLLERAGTGRVWTLASGSWTLESYTHPFEGRVSREEDFQLCAVYGTQAIWGLENDSSTTNIRSRIWIPG